MSAHDTLSTRTEATSDQLQSGHTFAIDGGEVGGRERLRANFRCPRCDHELTPGPWGSWICWRCDDVIYVEGGNDR